MSSARRSLARLEGEHWWFRGRRKVYLSHLRAAMGSVRVPRALDVGGADGGFAEALTAFAESVVELEPNDAGERSVAVEHAGPRLVGDVRALPFADRRFDLVTLFDVLGRAEDETRALAEVRRVVRPGGLVLVSVPAHDWLHAHGGDVPRRRYTRARLRRALEAADLTVERITHANVVLFPLLAPTVMLFKVLELLRIVPTSDRHTNLSVPTPKWLAALLYRAFTSELSLSGRFDLPFGHSIVALARRPVPSRTKRVKRRVQLVQCPATEPTAPLPSTPVRTETPTPAQLSPTQSAPPRAPLPSEPPSTPIEANDARPSP
ncbi:MAG: methyltransferase domain-containing protein [Planctomycetes bacterium]|nr:methyltransferase domain-containing protein [Planctomycetota bacterium]